MPETNDEFTEIPRNIETGMIEVLGENSRLVGQCLETLTALAEKVVSMPTQRNFVTLAIVLGTGVSISLVVSVLALVVAVTA